MAAMVDFALLLPRVLLSLLGAQGQFAGTYVSWGLLPMGSPASAASSHLAAPSSATGCPKRCLRAVHPCSSVAPMQSGVPVRRITQEEIHTFMSLTKSFHSVRKALRTNELALRLVHP